MLKSSARPVIRLRGVRHNNLKNFDLDLPLNQLIVITGLSGSGKSSLAFDTLYAEGQRRYIETFSPYARQFFDRMDKPQVDSIEGIPPAIAIEQRNAVKTTRSTVGTMTEICDYMKMLWPHVAQLHCRQCGGPVRKDSPQTIWSALQPGGTGNLKSKRREPIARVSPPGKKDGPVPLTPALSPEEREQRGATLDNSQSLGFADRLATILPLPSGEGRGEGDLAPESSQDKTRVADLLITFDLPLTERLSLAESLALVSKQGYQRLLVDGQIVRLDELASGAADHTSRLSSLTVIQDRLPLTAANRARFVEACEQAYHFGKGKLSTCEVHSPASILHPRRFSNRLHCAQCDLEYREPSPALFSFNHPAGACPTCRGFGRVISIDYDLALPDRSRTLAQGVVKPWQTGQGADCQRDLLRVCRQFDIPTNVPFDELPKMWQDFVINGESDYGKDEEHEWPRAWYGIKGYFRWLESRAYKMHVRVLLSRYRAYTQCPDCKGKRFQPEALLYRCAGQNSKAESRSLRDVQNPKSEVRGGTRALTTRNAEGDVVSGNGLTLADFYQLPIRDAVDFVNRLGEGHRVRPSDPLGLVLNEVRSRLGCLNEIGLGYLTLDRPTRTLSGGETERVNLTTCLGTRLVNTLYVLDEPSVGLHPRDTERLVRILQHLRDAGNTVVVVEHEASVMRAANQIVDLGPGHGATGGQVVFQGSYAQVLKARQSLTGQYLSGRRQIEIPERRVVGSAESRKTETRDPNARTGGPGGRDAAIPVIAPLAKMEKRNPRQPVLKLAHATRHNLRDVTVAIPLGRFVCVTGVSGSGKTTLIREVLLPALQAELSSRSAGMKTSECADPEENDADSAGSLPRRRVTDAPPSPLLCGVESLGRVVLVDQAILGKTPRSNPAVYIGAFDDIREFFAQSEPARQRGLSASAFSYNSAQGQCERCRGAGFEKIEMQFLSDVFIRCPDCNGRRYRPHVLEVKVSVKSEVRSPKSEIGPRGKRQRARTRESLDPRSLSIADLLDATVEEGIAFLSSCPESRPAQRAVESLRLLVEVGLGYLKLGQPINTLSGGESQRLKLVRHLAEALATAQATPREASAAEFKGERSADITIRTTPSGSTRRSGMPAPTASTLFLFDEPTTGLHFDDVNVLLKVFQRLVNAGHSVVVIEHNLDVIKSADWIIDLGPGAGDEGGQLIAQGTPEAVAACPHSYTGIALWEMRFTSKRITASIRAHDRARG